MFQSKRTSQVIRFYIKFCTILKVFPIQWNRELNKAELVPKNISTIVINWFNIIRLGAYVIYLWLSFILILKGKLKSPSLVSTEIHLTLCLAGSTTLVFIGHVLPNAEALTNYFNRAIKVFKRLQRKYSAEEFKTLNAKTKKKILLFEYGLQQILIAFITIPALCLVAFYFVDPLNKRYPVWLLFNNSNDVGSTNSYQKLLYETSFIKLGLVFMYSFICWYDSFICLNLTLMYGVYPAVNLCHSLHWVAKIIVPKNGTPEIRKSKDCFYVYRCIQILGQHFIEATNFIVPFLVMLVFVIGITCNYICLIHYHQLPLYILIIYASSSLIVLGVIFFLFPATAMIHLKSMRFINSWKNYLKSGRYNALLTCPEEKTYCLIFLKSCRHLGCPVGPFFIIKASTTYKPVLFLFLHTMKAILLFGKEKLKKR